MLLKESRASVANRCGIFLVKTINIYNKLKQWVYIGFFCKTSNQIVSVAKSFLKKKKNKSFFVRGAKANIRVDGSYIYFLTNYVVLLKKRLYIKGVVTFGPISITIRRKKAANSFIKKI